MDERTKKKARGWLKKFISKAVATGTLSAAAFLVSPFIAVFEAFEDVELAHLFLESIIGEELFEKIKEKLGVKKYSEKDIEEIYELARKDEKVRNMLAELVNELIDEKLLNELGKENPGSLEAIPQAVDELKKELPDIKEELEKLEIGVKEIEKRLEELEEKVKQLVGPRYLRNEDELIEELKMGWVKERKPVVSDKLRKKIEEAVKYIEKGEKVCIVGDAGIGKTTALYLACLHLMSEGIKLRVSGIEGEGVLVVDNIGAKENLLKKLENCTTPVIASARKSEWEKPRGWHEIRIEPEDQRPKLREMFISMLEANEVKYTEEAVDEILKRDPIPIFLSLIAEEFKGKEIGRKDASKIPKNVYEYIANVIKDCGDDLAVAILYCVTKTRTGQLHFIQLDILREMLKTKIPDLKGYGEYERLLFRLDGFFGTQWRNLMTGKGIPGEITLLIENIDAIRKIRAYDIEELLREVCSKSLDCMYRIEPDSAAELFERALENFPDLMEDALEVAKKDKYEDRKVLVLAVIVKILLDQGIALYIEGRLNDAIKRLKDAERICKNLKNKELFSNLARTFKTLGENLLAEDRPDDAIKRLKDAERIYIRYLPNDERSSRDVVEILNGLGGAFYMKERFNSSMNKLKSALEILEPLSDKPWYRDLLLETHIWIALVLLRKRNKRDAARHLCRALEMLTDKKAFENLISKKPLKTYISLLRNIPEELIPEECRENLRFYIE